MNYAALIKEKMGHAGAAFEKLLAGMDKTAKVYEETTGVSESRVVSGSQSSLAKVLTSAPGLLGEYYFPSELIGGCCPRVAGEEEDIVWNAAAEACDSERVHVAWHAIENRIWYIAVRSGELGSHPNTWCPFSSLLPGMKDSKPAPVCYTYYSDEAATMMTVTADGLQIHRGMSSVVRAKAERTSRDHGNCPIVELIPEEILKLSPVPWYSLSLFEDRARRILATFAVLTALSLAGLAFAAWLLTSMVIVATRANLSDTKERTEAKTKVLVQTASELRASPMRDQLASFGDVNDGLLAVNGFLEVYEIKEGKARWRAIVPSNVTADRINELGGKTIETTPEGVAIGNSEEVAYEAAKSTKK